MRARANRRGVTVDVIAGELLASGLRSPAVGGNAPSAHRSGTFGLIDVEYPDDIGDESVDDAVASADAGPAAPVTA